MIAVQLRQVRLRIDLAATERHLTSDAVELPYEFAGSHVGEITRLVRRTSFAGANPIVGSRA